MCQIVSAHCNSGKGFFPWRILLTAVLSAAFLLSGSPGYAADSAADAQSNSITGVTAQAKGKNLELTILGSALPIYTVYELPKLKKIVVDIAEAEVTNGADLVLPAKYKIGLSAKKITDVTPNLTRLEFTLSQSLPFKTNQQGNNIVVTLENFYKNAEVKSTPLQEKTASLKQPAIEKKSVSSIDSHLPEVDPLKPASNSSSRKGAAASGSGQSNDATFAFSGYDRKRITVDFYKIDLHNVFRLLREVSGANLVIDEGVSGSLTLALTDVPWDFALDIILNLKDLQKVETYGTIIIYPKGKNFEFKEAIQDNLTIETDTDLLDEEALVIQRQEQLPPGIVAARKLIKKGKKAEKRDDLENAVQLYEKALRKWPENGKLANRISALYLVHLRQNAKAVYFADKALAIDKNDRGAALKAAIAHANMNETNQAQQFFDQSVSGKAPSQEALMSYAFFCEKINRYDAALKLFDKKENMYGQDLDSMVARARILDKQGNHESAASVYEAILLSGFKVPPDLRKFINNKIKLSQSL